MKRALGSGWPNDVEQEVLPRAADAVKGRRRGGPILLERRRQPQTVERLAGGHRLIDGEYVVPADGERAGGGGWLYSAHRGRVLDVR